MGEPGTFGNSHEHYDNETEMHQQYARRLTEKIQAWSQAKNYLLRIHSFLMSLRGDVELLAGEV